MAELPEIARIAHQMQETLPGKRITGTEVLQPKILNLPAEDFFAALQGATIESAAYRGKWLTLKTSRGWLLFNLGMGGELLYLASREGLPEKRRALVLFHDATCLSVNFWWFGSMHFAALNALELHPALKKMGPSALEVTPENLRAGFKRQRGNIKSYLLDQSRIAGIGNAYVHDILFLARLHPLRKINTLSDEDITRLARAIQDGLRPSVEKGGNSYEVDLLGNHGGYNFMQEALVGYKEGKPCPVCSEVIQKIKTGSTSSFICPQCQQFD